MQSKEDTIYNKNTNELIVFTEGSPQVIYNEIQQQLYLWGDPFVIIIKKLNKPNGIYPYSVYTSRYFNHKAQVSYMTDDDVLLLKGDSHDNRNSKKTDNNN